MNLQITRNKFLSNNQDIKEDVLNCVIALFGGWGKLKNAVKENKHDLYMHHSFTNIHIVNVFARVKGDLQNLFYQSDEYNQHRVGSLYKKINRSGLLEKYRINTLGSLCEVLNSNGDQYKRFEAGLVASVYYIVSLIGSRLRGV